VTGELTVVGYCRVSTDDQAENGAGLEAQRVALREEAARRGWHLAAIHEDTASGRSMHRRPGLAAALDDLENGPANALLVAKLDRLSRSLIDFASLMARSQRNGWALVALDLGVDTSTPQGEMMVGVLAVFAQFERRLIGQRTREALAAKRAQGVRLGREPLPIDELARHVAGMRQAGMTLRGIAEQLNSDCVPTLGGSRAWSTSTVDGLLRRRALHPVLP
jgi:DNA invertase Pin-like site-specific DNA recombinase